MADVFISYFKPERSLTEALAKEIEAAGFTVWWDTHLLPDDRFRRVIDSEIEACTRATIIWTPQSIEGDWVISEAEHAHRLGELVNTFAGGLDPVRIPKPFGQVNAVLLEDRRKIIAALSRAASPGPSFAPAGAVYPIGEAANIVTTPWRGGPPRETRKGLQKRQRRKAEKVTGMTHGAVECCRGWSRAPAAN
jgi:hypothetical protein